MATMKRGATARRPATLAALVALLTALAVTTPPPGPLPATKSATGPELRDDEREGGEGDEAAEEIKAREDWFIDQRTVDGKLPKRAWKKSWRQADRLQAASLGTTDPLSWTEIGPSPLLGAAPMNPSGTVAWQYGGSTPYAGRVTSIAAHPGDPRIAYVGTAMGGLWRTANDGTTWTPIFDSVTSNTAASLAIGAVAVDPSSAGAAQDVVYVGTGEANNPGGYFGTGL